MTIIETRPPVAETANAGSYLDWPAILAGTAVASATTLLLLTFGSAIGLSLASPVEGSSMSLAGFAIAAGLWLVWVQVSGFFAGAYLTGRMRRRNYDASESESDVRDGAHGLTVWAVGLLVGAVIAFSGLNSAITAATTATSTAVAGAAAGAAGSADNLGDPSDILVDRFLRGERADAAGRQDPRMEITRIVAMSLANDTLDPADKDYLATMLAQRSGLDPQQAQARVDELWTKAQAAKAEALRVADHARRLSVIAAFATAASLLIAAVASYFGAVLGGNHRDKETVVVGWSRPF